MTHGAPLYEGKAKMVYPGDQPDQLVLYFKDDATAFNAAKKGTIVNKGVLNNRIATLNFQLLERAGVRTHFVRQLSEREMLVRRCTMVALEVVARNVVAGSLAKRLGKAEGEALAFPIVEWYFKNDVLGDPLINTDHIRVFQIATDAQVAQMRAAALKVNDVLVQYFARLGIRLIDFKLEFGVDASGALLLADEITPDSCRLWDATTGEKLDKDRFRRDLGKVEEAYQRVHDLMSANQE